MANEPLTLTARTVALGAFFGTAFLAAAQLGLHALFTFMNLDDGGTIAELLPVTVGAVTTTLGIVVGALFGSRTPA